MRRLAVTALTGPIRLYQRFISPLFPRRCKYEPTCSAYAVEAVRSFGALRGSVRAPDAKPADDDKSQRQ